MKTKTACLLAAVCCVALLLLMAPALAVADETKTISEGDVWDIQPNVGTVTLEITTTSTPYASVKVGAIYTVPSGPGASYTPPLPVNVMPGRTATMTLHRDGCKISNIRFNGTKGTVTISAKYSGSGM